ncbi:TMV resistance protein N-like protein, partial [Tanacetum coccineum]
MKNLKLLQLQYVELVGSYEKFPKLRWLRWHWCHLKTIPSGLFMSSLVAIDMSNGELEKFEPPTVLKSLKFLNLDGCDKLVSISSFHQLPKLETLVLWDCSNLTELCKTIGDLESLTVLNLTGCKKLWEVSLNKKYVKPERGKALCIGGGITEKPLIFLPHSLKSLLLGYCELEYKSDVCLAQPLYNLNLEGNPFELLPNNIDLKLLRILNLTSCPNLKSIICPSMLEELY